MTNLQITSNTVEVSAERASHEPHFRDPKLIGHLHTGTPHIHGALCSVVCIVLYVPNSMLWF